MALITDLNQHILAVADETNIPVSRLKLDRVLYNTLLFALAKDEFTIDDLEEGYEDNPFFISRYGHDLLSNRFDYIAYGSSPILERGVYQRQFQILDKVIEHYLNMNPFILCEEELNTPSYQKLYPKYKDYKDDRDYFINSNLQFNLTDIEDDAENLDV